MAQHDVIFRYLKETENQTGYRVNKVVVLNHLKLSPYEDMSELERRSATIEQSSEGETKLKSIKLYNILRLPQIEFSTKLLLITGAVGGIATETKVGTILGILGIIGAFLELGVKEFNKLEAEVLLAIYHLGKSCHIPSIKEEYRAIFQQELSEERLQGALKELEEYRVISCSNNEVEIIENLKIIR